MLPIKHTKEPLGKGLEVRPTPFPMKPLGLSDPIAPNTLQYFLGPDLEETSSAQESAGLR